MKPTEIEGLVSELRAMASDFHEATKDKYTADHQVYRDDVLFLIRAADALSQTIPRTDGNTITVSSMTLEWIAKKCADKRNPQVAFVVSKLLA